MERKMKAFQPVLVRNNVNAHWKCALYNNFNKRMNCHFCDNQPWNYVLPYSENIEYLIGTTIKPKSLKELLTQYNCANLEELKGNLANLLDWYTEKSWDFPKDSKLLNSINNLEHLLNKLDELKGNDFDIDLV